MQPIRTPDGYTVQFECQVEGTPRPQITWFRQTAVIKSSVDFHMYYDEDNIATLVIREVFPEDAGTFTCVAKNAAGFASSTAELIVEGPLSDHGSEMTSISISRKSLSRESSLGDILEGIPPTFYRKPRTVCVQEGEDVLVECRLVAVPEPDVQWGFKGRTLVSKDNVSISLESDMHMYTTVLRIKEVKRTQQGVYVIRAKNREGSTTVNFMLKVKTSDKEPPEVLEPLKNHSVREGDTLQLTTLIVGNPTPKVTWLKNGQPLRATTQKDDDRYTFTIHKATKNDTAEYTVTAENPLGTAETLSYVIVEGNCFFKNAILET